MANIINRTTGEYRTSVHTPDYDPAVWIVNPDLTAVAGVDQRWWTVDGDSVREQIDAEKLPTLKSDKQAALQSWYGQQQETGVTLTSGARMRTVDSARRDYAELLTMATPLVSAAPETMLAWWDADGTTHTGTPAQWIATALEYGSLAAAQRYRLAELEAAIDAAATVEQLAAINFDGGAE